MTYTQHIRSSAKAASGKSVLGFPLEGFGFFQSLLLSFASAFFTFFASTCIAIFSLLGWNLIGHHSVNYADSYLYVGLPAALFGAGHRFPPLCHAVGAGKAARVRRCRSAPFF